MFKVEFVIAALSFNSWTFRQASQFTVLSRSFFWLISFVHSLLFYYICHHFLPRINEAFWFRLFTLCKPTFSPDPTLRYHVIRLCRSLLLDESDSGLKQRWLSIYNNHKCTPDPVAVLCPDLSVSLQVPWWSWASRPSSPLAWSCSFSLEPRSLKWETHQRTELSLTALRNVSNQKS